MKYLKNYQTLLILILLIINSSCQNKKDTDNNEILESTNSAIVFREKLFDKKLMDSLIFKVVNRGDTIAYKELKAIYYIGEGKFTGLLYYSIVMSNKYNYKKASYDVYDILTNSDLVQLDKNTHKIANDYLLRSK